MPNPNHAAVGRESYPSSVTRQYEVPLLLWAAAAYLGLGEPVVLGHECQVMVPDHVDGGDPILGVASGMALPQEKGRAEARLAV